MATLEARDKVQYVTDRDGRRTAVLLEIGVWEALVEWMENATDSRIAAKALSELAATGGPRQAGWLAWDDVREEWGGDFPKVAGSAAPEI